MKIAILFDGASAFLALWPFAALGWWTLRARKHEPPVARAEPLSPAAVPLDRLRESLARPHEPLARPHELLLRLAWLVPAALTDNPVNVARPACAAATSDPPSVALAACCSSASET